MASGIQELAGMIRSIPDFPKKGIDFKDITTLLQNGPALKQVVDHFAERYADKGVDAVVAVEARGFILGGALACRLDAGFIPVRKKEDLELIIIDKLFNYLRNNNEKLHPSNPRLPLLYLVIKGAKPLFKVSEKDLREKICKNLPILDVRIYQKYSEFLKTLDQYLITESI